MLETQKTIDKGGFVCFNNPVFKDLIHKFQPLYHNFKLNFNSKLPAFSFHLLLSHLHFQSSFV